MSKNKDAKHRAKRFREEGLGLGAWQGRAGRSGNGENQGDEVKLAPEAAMVPRADKVKA